MRSAHRITIAAALAVSAVAGTAAATQTVHLGADHPKAPAVSASALAAQKAKLAAADRSIDTALAARPPALPKVPKFARLPEPRVPAVVVTKVVPLPAASAPVTTADRSDAPDDADAPAAPATTAAAPAPPAPARARARDDEGEDHADREDDAESEDRDEDHGPAQAEPSASQGSSGPGSEHGGED